MRVWSATEETRAYCVVLVRAGCFRRRVDGVESLLDPTAAYFEQPQEEHQVLHPGDGGDVCTGIRIEDVVLASIAGGEPRVPSGLVYTSPALDLQHRLLVSLCRRSGDPFRITEQAVSLVAGLLERIEPARVSSGRLKDF